MKYLFIGLAIALGSGFFQFIKKLKEAKNNGTEQDIRKYTSFVILCCCGFVLVLFASIAYTLNTPSYYEKQQSAKFPEFDLFTSLYKENAAKYKTDVLDWDFLKDEDNNTYVEQADEDWCIDIFITQDTPSRLKSAFYLFDMNVDQTKLFYLLFRMYALVLSIDTSINDKNVADFCANLLENIGQEIKSNNGIKYKLQETDDNLCHLTVMLDK